MQSVTVSGVLSQCGPFQLPGGHQRRSAVPDVQRGVRGEWQAAGTAAEGERTRESKC